MSLLNQVLQDLDERAPATAKRPVRLAGVPAVDTVDDDEGAWIERLQIPVLSLLIVSGLVAAGLFLFAKQGTVAYPAATQALPIPVREAAVPPAPESTPVPGAVQSVVEVAAARPTVPLDPPSSPDRKAPVAERTLMHDLTAVEAEPPEDTGKTLVTSAAVDYLPLRNTELQAEERPVSPAVGPVREVKIAERPSGSPLRGAREAIAAGELAEAETLLQHRLAAVPDDVTARELLVGLMLRGGRHDDALQQIDRGLGADPGHAKFLLIKARLLAQSGDTAAAVSLLETAGTRQPLARDLLQMLAALYQQSEQFGKAAETYRRLVASDPSSGAAWAGLAISLDGVGDIEAVKAYRRALEVGGMPAPAASYVRRRVAELESRDG